MNVSVCMGVCPNVPPMATTLVTKGQRPVPFPMKPVVHEVSDLENTENTSQEPSGSLYQRLASIFPHRKRYTWVLVLLVSLVLVIGLSGLFGLIYTISTRDKANTFISSLFGDPGRSRGISSNHPRPSDDSIHGRIPLSRETIESYQLLCTMDTCFQKGRCGNSSDNFRFYLYPRPSSYDPYFLYEPTFPEYNKDRAKQLWDQMYESFSRSPYRTDSPEEACIFIPYFDMTASATVTAPACLPKIEEALYSLPYWYVLPGNPQSDNIVRKDGNAKPGGENHLVFDRHEDDFQPFNSQRAILFRASLHSQYKRPFFDHTWAFRPEYFPCSFSKNETLAGQMRNLSVTQRPRLAYFRGIQSHPIRTKLLKCFEEENKSFSNANRDLFAFDDDDENYFLNNPDSVPTHRSTFQLTGSDRPFFEYSIPISAKEGAKNDIRDPFILLQDSQKAKEGDYCSLFGLSLFGLNPRGKGLLTYRTMEILQTGSVHVYIGDSYDLPYNDLLDYRNFSIIVPEIYACQLDGILSSFSMEELQKLQHNANSLYETYFITFEKELTLIWANLFSRIYHDWKLPSAIDPRLNTLLKSSS